MEAKPESKKVRRERMYVDGEWLDGSDTLTVSDLATDSVFGEVAAASSKQASAAIAAAHRASGALAETTIVERTRWLEAIADEIELREEELADAIVREAGKPISSARSEVGATTERFRRAAEEARALRGEFREGSTEGHEGWQAIVKPEPLGIVLCIAPYNYPLATAALQVAPALAAGNAVVLKPASKTPVSGAILSDAIASVDLPRGAFNFVPGRGSEIGDVLAGDDRVNAIAMTGSSAAGERVARQSGMVVLHMELGGNAPAVIFPDADLDAAAAACAKGALKYGGQRCSAISRVLAHESVHDELVDRIDAAMEGWEAGDLFDPDTQFGPLIDEEHAAWVKALIEDAVEAGAALVRGGGRDGRYVEPTLLAGVPREARILHEEQFGPVAAITKVADEEEAVARANEGDLALDAAVFTADYDRALGLADRLEAGTVRINGAPSHGLGDVPYGGNGASGIGREGIGTTIEELTRTKSVIL